MNIGVLGTGMVGQTISAKLSELGHDVMIGTRDVATTLARTEPHPYGFPPFGVWHQEHAQVKLGSLAEAAAYGDMLINATNGVGSLQALELAGESNLNGKILIDIANPLDFSQGMPPALSVCNTDSIGEQIQRAYPDVKVVKTLNTVTAFLMVNPAQVGDADHTLFVCGNDEAAKAQVTGWLKGWFGWKDVIDLGDITNARGTEMLLPIWVRLFGVLKTGMFNFKVVQ
ncbi:MAG: NAD(P)-binding domain-containing protein [Anaerolineaceae bacterium]|nr:NAD(P)-binding domain-containing protein [Anaerolineaceae bacterium]